MRCGWGGGASLTGIQMRTHFTSCPNRPGFSVNNLPLDPEKYGAKTACFLLERDGHRCCACGSAGRLHVHHRKPGVNDRELLITVCAGCHARLHRLAALRIWIPELLVALWIEQHPGVAVQLQFPVAA